MCCTDNLDHGDGDPGAGYWGAYACDTPTWTLDATLANIKKSHPDIDLILLTGDIPAHDIWQQSQEYNLYTIEVVAKAFEKYFPNIPVLPAVGNHESFPVNMFPGEVNLLCLIF